MGKVMVGTQPVSRDRNELKLARDEPCSLHHFSQSAGSQSTSLALVWDHPLQAAEMYLQRVGQIKFPESCESQQQSRTLFETLVEDTGRQSQAQEVDGQRKSSWLADLNISVWPPNECLNLEWGSEFSLDGSDSEPEGAMLAVVPTTSCEGEWTVGGNSGGAATFSLSPGESVVTEESNVQTGLVSNPPVSPQWEDDQGRDSAEAGLVSKWPQWEAVLDRIRAGAGYQKMVSPEESSQRSTGSSTFSSDSVSDEFIKERTARWGNGVATVLLKNRSEQATTSTSNKSSPGSSEDLSRVLEHIKYALSAFQLAFWICDAIDPDYPILYASDGFCHMTGYSVDELIGRNCQFLQGADTSFMEITRASKALKNGDVYTGTLRNYKKDGTPFWNLLTLSPIKDDQGKVVKYIAMQGEVNLDTVTSHHNEMIRCIDAQKSEIASTISDSPPPLSPASASSNSFDQEVTTPIFTLPPQKVRPIVLQRKGGIRCPVPAGRSRSMECSADRPRRGRSSSAKGRNFSIDSGWSEPGSRALTWQSAVRKSAVERLYCSSVSEEVPETVAMGDGRVKSKTARLRQRLGISGLLKNLSRKMPKCQEAYVPSVNAHDSDPDSKSNERWQPDTATESESEAPRCSSTGISTEQLQSYDAIASHIASEIRSEWTAYLDRYATTPLRE